MENDIVNRLQSFNLLEEGAKGFQLEPSDIQISHEECKRSLVGKVFGDKKANFTGLKNTLNGIWNTSKPFKISELKNNLFQFIFESEQDKMKIFNGRSWIFDGQYLILKQWSEELNVQSESFQRTLIWIQVWNLPAHWLSLNAGFRFNNMFEDVVDVLIPETGSKNGRHKKILASVNLEKPLLRGTNITCNSKSVWVDFKYEHLAIFCYYYGQVGQLEKNCVNKRQDITAGDVKQEQYGEWLRAMPLSRILRQPTERSLVKESVGDRNPIQTTEVGTESTEEVLIQGEASKGVRERKYPKIQEIVRSNGICVDLGAKADPRQELAVGCPTSGVSAEGIGGMQWMSKAPLCDVQEIGYRVQDLWSTL